MSAFSDWRLLVRLRARHSREFLMRLLVATGSDFSRDKSFSDRWYQLYILAFIGAAFVLMWFYLLDYIVRFFTAVGPTASTAFLNALLIVPALAFGLIALRGLHTSWIKMTHPDASYIAASPISSRAIVGNAFLVGLLKTAIFAGLSGYVLGTGLEAVLPASLSPLTCALLAALSVCMAFAAGRLVGIIRLAMPKRLRRRVGIVGSLCVILVAIAAGALSISIGRSAWDGDSFLQNACLISLLLLVVAAATLLLLAPRTDITAVVEDSALYADLQPFGMFSPLGFTAIDDYRRRCALARRTPILQMPRAKGAGALVAHAALSLIRQYEGLVNLLLFGAVVVPFGASLLSGSLGLIGLLFWLVMAISFARGPREAARVFRSDTRIRLVRDRLPFGTLSLLALDSLPAFVILAVAMTAVVAVTASVAGASFLILWGISLMTIVGSLLSCGLDAIRLTEHGSKLPAEAGLGTLAAGMGLASLSGNPLLTILVGLALCGGLALIVRRGVESA